MCYKRSPEPYTTPIPLWLSKDEDMSSLAMAEAQLSGDFEVRVLLG